MTPEELEAEAQELEFTALKKQRQAVAHWCDSKADALLKDAAIFREEAASKRAKAERLRKAVTT